MNVTLLEGAVLASGSAAVAWATHFPCPLYVTTGCWCAFCGSTRAVQALLHGQPADAVRDNGLTVLIVAFAATRLLLWTMGCGRVVEMVDGLIARVDMRIWTALLLVWTVVRNLPAFTALGPAA